MVFARPVGDGVHDVAAHHRAFAGHVVAATGTVRQRAVGIASDEIAGHHALEPVVGRVHVVVHDVHDHLEALSVQRLDHLLALGDAHGAVERIRRVGAFGDVVVKRIVAPVVLPRVVLVHGAVVVERQQLDRGDAELFEVVDARGELPFAVHGGAEVGEGQVFATVLERETAMRVRAEAGHMHLGHHRLAQRGDRVRVMLPAGRVGACEVDHHAAPAVHAGAFGPRVGGAHPVAILLFHQVVVVGAVQVPVEMDCPRAVALQFGPVGAHHGVAVLHAGTFGEEAQCHRLRRRGPDCELGAMVVRHGTQFTFQTQWERFCDTRLQSFGLPCERHVVIPSPNRTSTPGRSAASR